MTDNNSRPNSITYAVIIPTYNRSRLLRRAVESVLNQTHPVDEIVVVDDGSSDDTAAVAASYDRVRLITVTNGGPARARNAGIGITHCDWILFLDDDDWFEPGMVEEQCAMLAEYPDLDVIYTATNRVGSAGAILGRSHRGHQAPNNPLAAFARENVILCSAVGIRRTLLVDVGLFDADTWLCEDYDLWLRVAATKAKFAFIDKPLANISKEPGTRSDASERMAKALLLVLEKRSDLLDHLASGHGLGGRWWLAGAHYRLGRTYWETGNTDSAKQEFEIAAKHDPSHRGVKLYSWVSNKPSRAKVFLALRNIKRIGISALQKMGLAEARWG